MLQSQHPLPRAWIRGAEPRSRLGSARWEEKGICGALLGGEGGRKALNPGIQSCQSESQGTRELWWSRMWLCAPAAGIAAGAGICAWARCGCGVMLGCPGASRAPVQLNFPGLLEAEILLFSQNVSPKARWLWGAAPFEAKGEKGKE